MKTNTSGCLFLLMLILIFNDCSNAWRRRRRRRCPLRHCSVSKWTKWSSCSVPCGNNGFQTRQRHKTVTEQCGGQCRHPLNEVRPCNRDVCVGRGEPRPGACMCLAGFKGTCCEIATCRYNKCIPSEWSSWSELYPTQYGKCRREQRSRSYHLVIQTKDEYKCGDPGSQTCPSPEKQTREKETFCKPLTPPPSGNIISPECTHTKQRCGDICTLVCNEDNGYQAKGNNKKRCLMDGTWDGEELFCQDVQAPDITCPENFTVTSQNGISIHVALLPPVTSDNSGKTPTITSSVGGLVSSFAVSDEPYIITYTATDSSKNTRNCSFTVTVKSKCTDKDEECGLWAEQGWCQRSPSLMQVKCCKSCSDPCTDTDENCQDWKVDGLCDRNNPNFGYAKKHCQKTCDACDLK